MLSLRIVTCIALGISSAACGDGDKADSDANLEVQFPDGTTPDGEVSSSTSFVQLCDGYAAALCNLEGCFYPGSAVTDEQCRTATREICEDTIAGPIGTHIDGDIFFDGAAAEECFDHFADVACEDAGDATGDIPVACESAFNGTLAEGAACTFDALCKPELFCSQSVPGESGDTCNGTCAKRSLLGEACNDTDAVCARGLICGGTTPTCLAHHVATGQVCAYNENCPDGDWCKAHVCTTRTPLGQPCTNFDCASGSTCLDGTCKPYPDTAGDACENGCSNNLLCISNVCAAQPAEGDPCIGDFGSCGSEFTKRLQCDRTTNTCIKWYALGEPCGGVNKPASCDGGYCDGGVGIEGTCVAFKKAGEACEPFTSTCGRLYCSEAGVCAPIQSACRGPGYLAPL